MLVFGGKILVKLLPVVTWKTDNVPNALMALCEILRQNFGKISWLLLTAIDKVLTLRKR